MILVFPAGCRESLRRALLVYLSVAGVDAVMVPPGPGALSGGTVARERGTLAVSRSRGPPEAESPAARAWIIG